MFRGTYIHTIDNKGRTSVPAKFRAKLGAAEGEPLILTKGRDSSLILWPTKQWEQFESRLAGLGVFDEKAYRIKMAYVASSMECSFDKQGRILIPPSLREYASLTKEVYWVGQVTVVHILSKESYEKVMDAAQAEIDSINLTASELGL